MSMIQKRNGNRRRKRDSLKNLTHEQVNAAMSDYLANGGKITRIERVDDSFERFISTGSGSGMSDADAFLNGAL